ncbi:hypothetical protein GLYMA_06G068500v4 [Glycine max]|uniref:Gag1-like clamp domain-containing protein n=1 Tax=Glycine max TaxID=3847 RepID=A0A0R0JI82_SOYBN|nr:hypothetical protein GYH30_014302 [Glycine max]KRH52440.1 hypothetical protein GLYMA_06G068500v4 [Glycine max]
MIFVLDSEFSVTDLCSDFHKCISVDVFHLGSVRFSLAWGLLLWNQMRRQWVGNRRRENKKQVGEPIISWNATYESLMGTNKPFHRPIPLGEMVDFLVDIWEMEGLYD